MHDDYKQLETQFVMEPCPCCGATPQLWQYSEDNTGPTSKVVMCSRNEPIFPQQNGIVNEGCLLYMPPNQFYQPTVRAAVDYWNQFATALVALRMDGATPLREV